MRDCVRMRISFSDMKAQSEPTKAAKTPVAKKRALTRRIHTFLQRRPHRSFLRTRQRDYVRSLRLPGYWAFTAEVHALLWRHKKLTMLLVAFYGILTILFVGVASQDTYTQLSDTLRSTSGDLFKGNIGQLGQAGLLLLTGLAGNFSGASSGLQQTYGALLGLLMWLTIIWLLRAILAGHKPRLRDGLYNAGAPIVPTFLVSLVLVVQLLPLALAALGYKAAVSSNLLAGGVEAMLFWTVAGLLALLSLYWVTSTFFALIVVTLPGMYPMKAIRTAGDLVIGRRLRILYRLLWMLVIAAVVWAVVMVPIIIFATWLTGVWPNLHVLPIVPVVLLIMSALTIVWMATYIYLFYRKVVDDDAAPA